MLPELEAKLAAQKMHLWFPLSGSKPALMSETRPPFTCPVRMQHSHALGLSACAFAINSQSLLKDGLAHVLGLNHDLAPCMT